MLLHESTAHYKTTGKGKTVPYITTHLLSLINCFHFCICRSCTSGFGDCFYKYPQSCNAYLNGCQIYYNEKCCYNHDMSRETSYLRVLITRTDVHERNSKWLSLQNCAFILRRIKRGSVLVAVDVDMHEGCVGQIWGSTVTGPHSKLQHQMSPAC